jgi:hypothetical protein
MFFKKHYINQYRLKKYREWKASDSLGLAEKPLLDWDFYIHHTEEEIHDAEELRLNKLRDMINGL